MEKYKLLMRQPWPDGKDKNEAFEWGVLPEITV